jgi:hypothetical protein
LQYDALEKEDDQKDDQDQQQNATTDIHLQPPWSQVIRLDTRFAEEINPINVRVHKVLKTEPIGSALRTGSESPGMKPRIPTPRNARPKSSGRGWARDGLSCCLPSFGAGEEATDRRATTPTPPAA